MNRRTFFKCLLALAISSCSGPPLSYAADQPPKPSHNDREEVGVYDYYSVTPVWRHLV
jgi:hypothetical protein